ncbi:MAG: hypothetical protein ACE144_01275 [Thermodesulfobacteriota bacterium]
MSRTYLAGRMLKVLLILLISAPSVSPALESSERLPQMAAEGQKQPGSTIPIVPTRPLVLDPDGQPISPTVEPPDPTKYECPKTRYINCMPPVQEIFKPMCTEDYLEWAKRHCTGFEVVY